MGPWDIHDVSNPIALLYCPALADTSTDKMAVSVLASNQDERSNIECTVPHSNCTENADWLLAPSVFILQFLDGKDFMDWSTTPWSQGYVRASHAFPRHLTLQLLQFMPRPTPLLHPDTQTVSVAAAVLHSTINILIAVLFRLLGQALYF